MDKEFYVKVLECVSIAVSGKGVIPKNKVCGRIAQQLNAEYGVKNVELVNGIMSFILIESLMARYRPENSLGWYVVGIVFNYLRNELRSCIRYAEMKRELKQELEVGVYDFPTYGGSPEDQFFEKERELIILNHTTPLELELVKGEMSVQEFAEKAKITYECAKKRKKRLVVKLLKALKEGGYDENI